MFTQIYLSLLISALLWDNAVLRWLPMKNSFGFNTAHVVIMDGRKWSLGVANENNIPLDATRKVAARIIALSLNSAVLLLIV